MTDEVKLFAFEDDFVQTLRCIPMAVRFKLDRCGVKLSLRQWSCLTAADRQSSLLEPCASQSEVLQYRDWLVALLLERTQEQARPLPTGSTVPWDQLGQTPDAVRSFATSVDVDPPADLAWRQLTDLQRFALLKLSRDNHDNVNFIPALREFGLYRVRGASAAAS